MDALRSLLVGIDLSVGSRHAAGRALRLAEAVGSLEVTLVHAIEISLRDRLRLFFEGTEDPAAQLESGARGALGELLAEFVVPAATAVHLEVVIGAVADVLSEGAKTHDILLLGAHGAHPLRDHFLGTTAMRALRQTTRPTLVVRTPPEGPYRRVTVAVDFSEPSARALAAARRVAPDAKLEVLHAVPPLLEPTLIYANVPEAVVEEHRRRAAESARAELLTFLARCAVPDAEVMTTLVHGYPPEVLHAALSQRGSDLLVLGKHGKSALSRLLLGSLTQHALAEAPCDVLIVS